VTVASKSRKTSLSASTTYLPRQLSLQSTSLDPLPRLKKVFLPLNRRAVLYLEKKALPHHDDAVPHRHHRERRLPLSRLPHPQR
jgi:hypothetical protein